jgi:diguanylate cyclase (GGDEF)-like protein
LTKLAKILVVDDAIVNRTLYAECLRKLPDVEVFEVESGPEALELARHHEFAMYLLDVVMPGMDGFELASLLREDPRSDGVPILFVTAYSADEAIVTRGYRMGAVDFMVTKPVSADVIQQKARVFLRLYAKRKELGDLVEHVKQENVALHMKLQEFLREQEELRRLATHDPLTLLPNRALFRDRVEQALSRARRGKHLVAVAYLDLDGFKAVNDGHGHDAGDALLVEVARRLKGAIRESDTLARLGGDEFALVLEGLDSAAAAEYALTEKVLRAVTAPVDLRSGPKDRVVVVHPGVSIGVAVFPEHADGAEQLTARADTAMYAAKRGGGGVQVYGAVTSAPAGDRERRARGKRH